MFPSLYKAQKNHQFNRQIMGWKDESNEKQRAAIVKGRL